MVWNECSRLQTGAYSTKGELGPSPQQRVPFPTDILRQNPRRIDPRLTAQIAERRESPDRALAEQIAARAPDLITPDYSP
jgi:hypothetical protein